MKIAIDGAGGGERYVWVSTKDGYIELSIGTNARSGRDAVTGLSREQALTLAHALRTVVSALPAPNYLLLE